MSLALWKVWFPLLVFAIFMLAKTFYADVRTYTCALNGDGDVHGYKGRNDVTSNYRSLNNCP